jgi:type II secretory pathway component PulM
MKRQIKRRKSRSPTPAQAAMLKTPASVVEAIRKQAPDEAVSKADLLDLLTERKVH